MDPGKTCIESIDTGKRIMQRSTFGLVSSDEIICLVFSDMSNEIR